jgi:hypothetical protein
LISKIDVTLIRIESALERAIFEIEEGEEKLIKTNTNLEGQVDALKQIRVNLAKLWEALYSDYDNLPQIKR